MKTRRYDSVRLLSLATVLVISVLSLTIESAIAGKLTVEGAAQPPITISVSDVRVDESEGYATAQVQLSGVSVQVVSVVAFTFGDTALPGKDYYGRSQTLTFSPGEQNKSIRIEILDDTLNEGSEQFKIGLGNASNASVENGVAIVSIDDDDRADSATINIRDVSINEAGGFADVELTLSSPLTESSSVTVYTQAASATPGSDFYGRTARVNFSNGEVSQTFRVQILDDNVVEQSEVLSVFVVNPSSNLQPGKRQAEITITDNDEQLSTRSTFTPLEAEHHDAMSGVRLFNGVIGYLDNADWLRFDRVDFGDLTNQFFVKLAVPADNAGGRIELRLDSLDGKIVGTMNVADTGGWDIYNTQSIDTDDITGVHDLYIRFLTDLGGVANIDWFQFGPRRADGPVRPVSRELFGMHMHTIGFDGAWPSVPFAVYRIHDTAGAFWRDVEPQQDQWNWQAMDRAVGLAEINNAEILYTLGQTPAWAAADPNSESAYEVPGSSSPPRSLQDWRDYVRAVVERYRGRIKYYEVWNEVDQATFYSGDLSYLVSMAREAAEQIQAMDPQAVVIAPSFVANEFGIAKLDEYLGLGGGAYADIINVHFYLGGTDPPESIPVVAAKVRWVMQQNGQISKPLWNTESNFGYSQSNQFITGDDALGYVARAYLVQWHAGIDRHYWYAWENNNFVGIRFIDPATGQPTEATQAYRAIQDWMISKTLNECRIDENESWRCTFTDRNASKSQQSFEVVWNPRTSVSWQLPASASAIRTLRGEREAVTGGQNIELSGMPIYIELSN